MNFNKKEILDFIKDLVIIILVVVFIRTFIAEPFQISWWSMNPSYYDKEFIIVDRFSYLDIPYIKKWVVKRGDVVVLKPHVDTEKEFFLKRIIGLPGETLKIKDWEVYIKKVWAKDFVKLNEKYLNKENKWHTKIGNLTKETIYKIPKWKYFVMWDNRNHSSDSRTCFSFSCIWTSRDSFIEKKDIVWKVLIDLWYFNFKKLNFTNPWNHYSETKWIDTYPRFLNHPSSFNYE